MRRMARTGTGTSAGAAFTADRTAKWSNARGSAGIAAPLLVAHDEAALRRRCVPMRVSGSADVAAAIAATRSRTVGGAVNSSS